MNKCKVCSRHLSPLLLDTRPNPTYHNQFVSQCLESSLDFKVFVKSLLEQALMTPAVLLVQQHDSLILLDQRLEPLHVDLELRLSCRSSFRALDFFLQPLLFFFLLLEPNLVISSSVLQTWNLLFLESFFSTAELLSSCRTKPRASVEHLNYSSTGSRPSGSSLTCLSPQCIYMAENSRYWPPTVLVRYTLSCVQMKDYRGGPSSRWFQMTQDRIWDLWGDGFLHRLVVFSMCGGCFLVCMDLISDGLICFYKRQKYTDFMNSIF